MGMLSLYSKFFEPSPGGGPSIGDLYWVPVSYVEECPWILTTDRASAANHTNIQFCLEQIGQDHYRGQRTLPIQLLQLSAKEELLAAKSKRRPAVVITSAVIPQGDIAGLASPEERRRSSTLGRTVYIVAPLYSCSTLTNPTTFGSELVGRVRHLEYPHLFCLPDHVSGGSDPRSIVRFDSLVATKLGRGSQKIGYRVHPDVLGVMKDMFQLFALGIESTDLKALRELLAT